MGVQEVLGAAALVDLRSIAAATKLGEPIDRSSAFSGADSHTECLTCPRAVGEGRKGDEGDVDNSDLLQIRVLPAPPWWQPMPPPRVPAKPTHKPSTPKTPTGGPAAREPAAPDGDEDEDEDEEVEKYFEGGEVSPDELPEPTRLRSPVTIEMKPTELYTPWITKGGFFTTRGFGSVPGPVIVTKAGEALQITLQNQLRPPNAGCSKSYQEGAFPNPLAHCKMNTTSLHSHGLHISPQDPGDNALREVLPGGQWQYTFNLPRDHMAGTHWIHPHVHHATAPQVAGGAHSMLIVEDPPNSLPPEIAAMQEKIMVVTLVDVPSQLRQEKEGQGRLWRYSARLPSSYSQSPKTIVNGRFEPTMTVQPGQWYRLRLLYAASEDSLQISWRVKQGHPACSVGLLAKDGVYLNKAPRKLTKDFTIYPGGRADLALGCSCPGSTPCGMWMTWVSKHEPFGDGETTQPVSTSKGRLVYISIQGKGALSDLPPFKVNRPCYLADLMSTAVPKANKHKLGMPEMPPLTMNWDKGKHLMGKNPQLATLQSGQVHETALSGILYHPLHIHVAPFQVVDVQETEYLRKGDWHDTLRLSRGNSATIRWQTDRFTGTYVVHCHILEHEDAGMMGYIKVNGQEGATWSGARNCYTGAAGAGFTLL